ncbi:unnamed protein product, partial [marine sediment metagenome]
MDKVERFDQKNEMWRRPRWDPSQREIGRKVYGTSFTHIRENGGYTQIDLALGVAGWHVEIAFAHGNVTENTDLYRWDMDLLLPYGGAKQPIPDEPYRVSDPSYMSQVIKKAARFFGASGAGGSLNDLTIEMVKSVAARFLTLDQIKQMAHRSGADRGDLLLIVAGKPKLVDVALSELRQEMGHRLELADPNLLAFAFIVAFPLLDRNEETGLWEPMHHPFTAPRDEDVSLLDSAPEKVRAKHYDLVCNGCEIAGGSLRIYTSELQR